MKLIILEGIPTSGKTVLGEKITSTLKKELDPSKFDVYYFNDDVRNTYDIDVIGLLKKGMPLTVETVTEHLRSILETLKNIEQESEKKPIFVLDRFHFSYLSFLKCGVKEFAQLEKGISGFVLYLFLGFKHFDKQTIYNRFQQSLSLRGEDHGFTNYFKKLTEDKSKGSTPEERIYNHYLTRYQVYNESFEKTALSNKEFIPIDAVIKKEDYASVLISLNETLFDFMA